MSVNRVEFLLLLLLAGYLNITNSYFDGSEEEIPECKCVPSDLCADNDQTATGQGVLDIRFESETCPDPSHICCDLPIEKTDALYTRKCGFSHRRNVGVRITSNSEKTEIGELPWTVLVYSSSNHTAIICGGSIIHPQVVITAAHCASKNLKVRGGEWSLKTKNEPLPHQDRDVKDIVIHQGYKQGTLWNDIALLILNEPFNENDNIGFICLPSGTSKISEKDCIVGGWGRRSFTRKRMSAVLRKVKLPLVPRAKCQQKLRGTRLGKSFRLHKSFLCAGGEKNKDTCKGDGGSPLVCPVMEEEGRFVQVGIVSWGIGCGENDTPGVYVNVGVYASWIDKQLKDRDFLTDYYKMS